jgi:NADH:ubiquinone oxidoreductase subunit F (NADH-binding)
MLHQPGEKLLIPHDAHLVRRKVTIVSRVRRQLDAVRRIELSRPIIDSVRMGRGGAGIAVWLKWLR